jgi:hypothetical protein
MPARSHTILDDFPKLPKLLVLPLREEYEIFQAEREILPIPGVGKIIKKKHSGRRHPSPTKVSAHLLLRGSRKWIRYVGF